MTDRQPDQDPPADPSGIPEPHDVLAAEEFGIGTRDERFPSDPTGIEEPHDVLAAEEFAMPSPEDLATPGSGGPGARAWGPAAALAVVLLLLLRRRRR